MLVDSCSDGLRAAILHHDFDNGLRDAMLVEWRVGSLIDSARQRLSLPFARRDTSPRLSLRFARRHARRVERRLADVEAEDDAGSKVSEWELRERQDREVERRAEKLGAEE